MNSTITDERLKEILDGCEGVQGGPWKLDAFGCYIWAPSEKGGDFPIADDIAEKGRVLELRGWGYYTGDGHGALGLPPDEAKARQKRTGNHIARLDPATVAAMAVELLAAREALSAGIDAAVADLETKMPGVFWHVAKGRLSAKEPMFAAGIFFGEQEVGIAETDISPAEAIRLATARALSGNRSGK